jgi:hypothetical protein
MKIPSPIPRELVLIVDPKAGLRVRNETIIGTEEDLVGPLRNLLLSEQAIIRPLYGVSEDWVKNRTPETPTRMGVEQPLDLSIFYKVTVSNKKLETLAAQLRELKIAQSAYIKPGMDVASNGAFSGDFTGHQEYLNAGPEGVDARYAWTKAGGRGNSVNIMDVEGAWRFSHEDLVANPSGCLGGVPTTDRRWERHGTAVVGMLSGDHNGFGIAGICPEARVNTISVFGNSNGEPAPDWSYAAPIRLAADMLRPGDILLIELHHPGPVAGFEDRNDQYGYIPVEWWPCNMAAIQYATTRGIIVVEAGGNGKQNLDNAIYDVNPSPPHGPFPGWWRNPFRRNPVDTKATLVGAGAPPDGIHGSAFGTDRSRLNYSNFGSMMDTQGWGEEVATCGGNNNLTPLAEEDRHYTRGFRGTSSAAAMVAGALACLQGVIRARGATITPSRVRDLLRNDSLGSLQQVGPFMSPGERIGPRPDLRKLIEHLIPPA